MVSEQLQHDCVQDDRRRLVHFRDLEDIGRDSVERAIPLGDQGQDRRVAGDDLVDVADHLVFGRAGGADGDHGKLIVEQGDGPVLQLAARCPFCVYVRDLLQLQRALERDRVAQPAAREHEVAVLAVFVGQLDDLLLSGEDVADLVGKRPQRLDQLPLAFWRNASLDIRKPHRKQVEADDVRVQSLGRGDADFGPGVQVNRAVGVASGGACDHVRRRDRERAASLGLLHCDKGVRRFSGLGDHDAERLLADGRPPVAELRRVLRSGGDP